MGLPLFTLNNNQGDSLSSCIWHWCDDPYRRGGTLDKEAIFPGSPERGKHEGQTWYERRNPREKKIKEEATKLCALRRYKTKVRPRAFQPSYLVWRVWGEASKFLWAGKLGPNWEGPFKVMASLDNGAYKLQELDGKAIPRTWNATHLKFYFSWSTTRPGVVLFFLIKSFVPK